MFNSSDKYKIVTKYIKINDVKGFIQHNQLNSFENCEKYCDKIYKFVKKHNECKYNDYINKKYYGRY